MYIRFAFAKLQTSDFVRKQNWSNWKSISKIIKARIDFEEQEITNICIVCSWIIIKYISIILRGL